MPLHFTRKSIFDNNPSVIINTANCIGVMGKGIADQISRRYPGVKAHFGVVWSARRLPIVCSARRTSAMSDLSFQ